MLKSSCLAGHINEPYVRWSSGRACSPSLMRSQTIYILPPAPAPSSTLRASGAAALFPSASNPEVITRTMSEPSFTWDTLTLEQQRAIVALLQGDGHTIWKTQPFLDAGIPQSFVDYFITYYESDLSDPKATIFRDGVPITATQGIYGLRVIESLAAYHQVRSNKSGRGFRAGDLTTQLLAGPLRLV